MPTLIPSRGRLLVRQHETQEMSEGGIHLPDKAQTAPKLATVVSVGENEITKDGVHIPIEVGPGDVVVMPNEDYAGTKITHEGEELKILNNNEVLAYIKKVAL